MWRGPLAEESFLWVLQNDFFCFFSSSREAWLDSSLPPSRIGQGPAQDRAGSGGRVASVGKDIVKPLL